MPKIIGHKIRVPITIAALQWQTIGTSDGETFVAKVQGEDESGNDGVATVWLGNRTSKFPPPGMEGKTDFEIGTKLLTELGMDLSDPTDTSSIEGQPAEFYVTEKDGFHNYSLQKRGGNARKLEADEVTAAFAGKGVLGSVPAADDLDMGGKEEDADSIPF